MRKIECADGVLRTPKQYGEWLANLQELAELEPNDLTEQEYLALENEGLIND